MMLTFFNSEKMRSFIHNKRGLLNDFVVKEENIRKLSTEECMDVSAMKLGHLRGGTKTVLMCNNFS